MPSQSYEGILLERSFKLCDVSGGCYQIFLPNYSCRSICKEEASYVSWIGFVLRLVVELKFMVYTLLDIRLGSVWCLNWFLDLCPLHISLLLHQHKSLEVCNNWRNRSWKVCNRDRCCKCIFILWFQVPLILIREIVIKFQVIIELSAIYYFHYSSEKEDGEDCWNSSRKFQCF